MSLLKAAVGYYSDRRRPALAKLVSNDTPFSGETPIRELGCALADSVATTRSAEAKEAGNAGWCRHCSQIRLTLLPSGVDMCLHYR